jgi:hypothetical protein
MAFFFFMLVMMMVLIVPVVIITVARVVPRVVDRVVPPVKGPSPELEARLTRIEDAIDAMAEEIERIRTGDLDEVQSSPRLKGDSGLS